MRRGPASAPARPSIASQRQGSAWLSARPSWICTGTVTATTARRSARWGSTQTRPTARARAAALRFSSTTTDASSIAPRAISQIQLRIACCPRLAMVTPSATIPRHNACPPVPPGRSQTAHRATASPSARPEPMASYSSASRIARSAALHTQTSPSSACPPAPTEPIPSSEPACPIAQATPTNAKTQGSAIPPAPPHCGPTPSRIAASRPASTIGTDRAQGPRPASACR